MFNLITRTVLRPVVFACLVFAGANAAFAQIPQSTPRPTPAPGDPTRPPGTEPDSRAPHANAESDGAAGNAANESDCGAGNFVTPQHTGADKPAGRCRGETAGAPARTGDSDVSSAATPAGSESDPSGRWQ